MLILSIMPAMLPMPPLIPPKFPTPTAYRAEGRATINRINSRKHHFNIFTSWKKFRSHFKYIIIIANLLFPGKASDRACQAVFSTFFIPCNCRMAFGAGELHVWLEWRYTVSSRPGILSLKQYQRHRKWQATQSPLTLKALFPS